VIAATLAESATFSWTSACNSRIADNIAGSHVHSNRSARICEALLPHSEVPDVAGLECRFVDLQTLIRLKRAAGRPRDLERIAELEALRQEEP
jgi:hypothetical protein